MNTPEFVRYFEQLNAIYAELHNSALNKCAGKTRKDFWAYTPLMFNRWYSSASVKDTLLSPANLTRLAGERCLDAQGSLVCPQILVLQTPVPAFGVDNEFTYKMSFMPMTYTLDDHPILKDFRAFLACSSPMITVDETQHITKDTEVFILHHLSIKDAFYLEYMLMIARELGLFKPSRGVHCIQLIQAQEAVDEFLRYSPREMLTVIVDQSMRISLTYLRSMIPGYNIPLPPDFIESLLKSPLPTREIFSRLYAELVLSFEMMFADGIEFEITTSQIEGSKRSSELTEQDFFQMFSASSFMLNTVFVKYFFSIFGTYLRFIDQFFDEPFDFVVFKDILESVPNEAVGMFVSPCTHYSLTALGMAYFGIDVSPSQNKTMDTEATLDELFALLPRADKRPLSVGVIVNKYSKNFAKTKAYQFKIYSIDSPELWKILTVDGAYTLDLLHSLICDEFFIEFTTYYHFNTDRDMNPFTKYTPPTEESRFKKTTETKVSDLTLGKRDSFYYVLDYGTSFFAKNFDSPEQEQIYRIDVMEITDAIGIELYPKLVKASARIRDLEEETSFFE
ncbi:hypothetical protein AGMMS49975_12520 [Clostridia bacterium]|nr:hypothetical protein AGMMS49975_12520 [Clostridia bacterium]